MRRLAWAFVVPLLVAIPAVGFEKPLVPQREVIMQPVHPTDPVPGNGNYKPPELKDGVVELLDEGVEPLFPLLINDGGNEPGTINREDRDVFAGVEAVRVTPLQKYRIATPRLELQGCREPETPAGRRRLRSRSATCASPGRRSGGQGIMVQFHDPVKSWAMRYFAGQNAVGWTAMSVSPKLPIEWEVVTRDLFKEHGEFNITGMALTAMYGDADFALFDHMLLGQSVAELDRATDLALGRMRPAKPLAGKDRDAAWANLLGSDRAKATSAIRTFLASAPDQVTYIGEMLAKPDAEKDRTARIRKLAADLDDDDFDVRESATAALVKVGAPVLDAMRTLAANSPSDEVRFRARVILRKLGADGKPVGQSGKMARIVRVLERAGTQDARDLLTRTADGEFGFDGAPDARMALNRLAKKP